MGCAYEFRVGLGGARVVTLIRSLDSCRVTPGMKNGDTLELDDIVDLESHPIEDEAFVALCEKKLEQNGVLVLEGFVTPQALNGMLTEAEDEAASAFFCTQQHSVYLNPQNPKYDASHPANRLVESSKGCICDDQIPPTSPLRSLYDAEEFRSFIKGVTGEGALFPYADPLSSINVHYAKRGQELGWHFDNSSFAVTLLIKKPDAGSRFEYIKDLRDADAGEMNFEGVAALLDGATTPEVLEIQPGDLVLFRGRNSIHRVSPNESDRTRILAVLAYNSEPGVSLSESARMTFYGRLG